MKRRSFPLLLLLFVSLMGTLPLVPSVEATPDTFGYTTAGGTPQALADNTKYACRFWLGVDAEVTKITAVVANGPGGMSVQAVIYDDLAGAPNALKGTSSPTIVYGIAWYDFMFSPSVSLSGGAYYWLGIIIGALTAATTYAYDAGVANQLAYKTDAPPPSNPFGVPDGYQARKMSIYATYTAVYPKFYTEDFTTYTEEDPNSHITVSADQIHAYSYLNEDAYVYDDKGIDHFGDFEHLVDAKGVDQARYERYTFWLLSNAVDDVYGLYLAEETYIQARFWGDATGFTAQLLERYGAFYGADTSTVLSLNTMYYFKIVKSGTSLTCYIYSEPARATLVDTLTLTLQADHKLRYIFAFNTWNSAAEGYESEGYTENLGLQEPQTRNWFGSVAPTFVVICEKSVGFSLLRTVNPTFSVFSGRTWAFALFRAVNPTFSFALQKAISFSLFSTINLASAITSVFNYFQTLNLFGTINPAFSLILEKTMSLTLFQSISPVFTLNILATFITTFIDWFGTINPTFTVNRVIEVVGYATIGFVLIVVLSGFALMALIGVIVWHSKK